MKCEDYDMKSPVQQKIDEFYSKYPERHFTKGQILIYAGDDPPGIFYLTSGQVKQYDITESGNETIVKVYKAPSILPLSWLINRTHNKYFYECFTDATIRSAPVDIVDVFLRDNSDVTYDLLSSAYAGMEDLYTRLIYAMGESAQNRTIMELLLECKKYGVQQPDGSYVLNIHESDIAARTGLSRETISRHLSSIIPNDLVTVGRKNITIRDIELLENELHKKPK